MNIRDIMNWFKRNPDEIKTEQEMRDKAQESSFDVIWGLIAIVVLIMVATLAPNSSTFFILAALLMSILVIGAHIHIRYWDTRVHLLRMEQKIEKLKEKKQ